MPGAGDAAAPAGASTIRYRTDAELVALSERVVHARVLKQRTERPEPSGAIFTVTTLAVLEDLTGVLGDTVEVWELGGLYGDEGMFVGGAVQYVMGGEVLVCLERGRFGLRSVAMGFSKFDVARVAGPVADALLARNLSGLQTVGGSVPGPERTLAQFRELTVQVRGVPSIRNASAELMVPDAAQPRFTTLPGRPRWCEADSGTPVLWYQNSNAPHPLGPLGTGSAITEVTAALQAWNIPNSASIFLQYDGSTFQSAPLGPWIGISGNAGVINWEDPLDNISGLTIALGGGFSSSSTCAVNGLAYHRLIRGYVLFQNAADLPASFREPRDFIRMLEHEFGHTIGLDHTDTPDNIMFPSCCSSATPELPFLGPDDLLGLNTIYPIGSADSCSSRFRRHRRHRPPRADLGR